MNSPIEELQRIVSQRMCDQGAGHGMDHVLRVLHNARLIQAEVGGDLAIVEMAALLHDVGDAKFHQGVERSAEFSREILAQLDVVPATIEKVAAIVDRISFRHGIDASQLSHEAKIVQDADRLDALGAIGIVRTAEYGASVGQPFFSPDVDLPESKTGIGHFYQKLFKLRAQLNTEPAKRMAVEREQFMHLFLNQYLKESGLVDGYPSQLPSTTAHAARRDALSTYGATFAEQKATILRCGTSNQQPRLFELVRQRLAITSDEQLQSTSSLFRWRGLKLLGGFLAVTLVGNVLVPTMFDNVNWGIGWMQFAFLASGLLVAQFAALALWCVLGVGQVAPRLTVTLGLSCLCCFAFMLGLRLIGELEQPAAIYILVCGVGGFVFACLPLLIARYYGGYRFRLATLGLSNDNSLHQLDSQVSLKYLIGLTTGAAVLLALFRAIFPDGSNGGPPSAFVLLMVILQNAVFTLLWLWACVALFAGGMSRAMKILVLLGVCVLVTPVHVLLMEWFYPFQIGWTETLNAYAYAIGFSGYTWLTLTLAWLFGIELRPLQSEKNEQ
jgi:uncharacterized protein